MAKTLIFAWLFVGTFSAAIAADNFVTFPYSANPCSVVLLTVTCCSGVQVKSVGFTKKMCVVMTFKLLPISIDMTIKLDDKVLAAFNFNDKNPPTYCIPIALPINVSMCLKIHDIKLVGIINIQMCMTAYAGYQGSNVYVLPFNCVKVGAGSMTYFTTTTTTPKPSG